MSGSTERPIRDCNIAEISLNKEAQEKGKSFFASRATSGQDTAVPRIQAMGGIFNLYIKDFVFRRGQRDCYP